MGIDLICSVATVFDAAFIVKNLNMLSIPSYLGAVSPLLVELFTGLELALRGLEGGGGDQVVGVSVLAEFHCGSDGVRGLTGDESHTWGRKEKVVLEFGLNI